MRIGLAGLFSRQSFQRKVTANKDLRHIIIAAQRRACAAVARVSIEPFWIALFRHIWPEMDAVQVYLSPRLPRRRQPPDVRPWFRHARVF
jgi:hypothetical protein